MYLDNKELLAEVIQCLDNGEVMSDKLARMLMLLTKKYARMPSFISYSYNEDMQGYALMQLCHTWKRFDPERSDQAFAYYTQAIKNSFKQYLNREKTQRNVRDSLLIQGGAEPSQTYTDNKEHEKEIENGKKIRSSTVRNNRNNVAQ